MNPILIRNLTRPENEPVRAKYCASFLCRLRGLTFRRKLDSDEALLLVQTRDSRMDAAIHMMAVWTDLAVVWINNQGDVVDSCLARSWQLYYIPRKAARYVLEMAPERLGLFQIGDRVRLEQIALD